MAQLVYRKASYSDIEQLIETRIEVLKAVFHLADDADTTEIRNASAQYYKDGFEKDMHAAYLVLDCSDGGEVFAGAGGVSFYQVMPTCDNPSGRKAYIMNMYTRPEYRRQGIAGQTLELLIREARDRGIDHITLDASDMGRPVYAKHGFVKMEDEMKLQQ